jgi:hypothetical protein
MSVIRMLTRMCAVSALRGQTWADKRVFDSDNTPLSQALMLNESAKPYIVVFTDADNYIDQNGTDLYGMRREMNLVLEIGVASKVVGKTGGEEIKIPLTDEGMELALDMVESQALAALFGDPKNDWAELLKELVLRVERLTGQRGASSDRDHRWAARQLGIVCDIVSDLPSGVPVPEDHPIRKFIETAAEHPEASMDAVSEICAAICADTGAPEWERVQAMTGGRRLALRAIGLAPLSSELPIFATSHGEDLTDTRGEAPILREIGHDDIDMEKDESVGLVDEFTIRTNVMDVKVKDKPDKVVADGEVE